MAVIYITEADNAQHKYRLPDDPAHIVTIGRGENCMVSLPDVLGLSRLHCSIVLKDGRYFIRDEGSTNGTLDGKRPISMEVLQSDVVYSIGSAKLSYEPELALPPVPAAAGHVAATPAVPAADKAADAPADSSAAPAADKAEARPEAPAEPKQEPAGQKAAAPRRARRKMPRLLCWLLLVVVVLIAFAAGMMLRCWVDTGSFLPACEAPAEPAPAES